jgi:RNA exonuclease 1
LQKRKEVVKQYRQLYSRLKSKAKEQSKQESQTQRAKNTSDLDKIPRTSLLLSIPQMLREDYPLAFDLSQSHDMSNYVYTKDVYEPVDNNSPLYSIDCEMCYNVDGEMETVWLALVDESLECIYETYVKPRKKILNYLTG